MMLDRRGPRPGPGSVPTLTLTWTQVAGISYAYQRVYSHKAVTKKGKKNGTAYVKSRQKLGRVNLQGGADLCIENAELICNK